METDSLDPSEVEGIKIVVSPVNRMLCEPEKSKKNPATAIDAKFSLPFVIATALLRGRVKLDDFTPQALAGQDVLEMARKVLYEVDTELTMKEAVQGFVQVHTKDSILSRRVELPYGHPQNPISRAALVSKFIDCAKHSAKRISDRRLDEVVELTANLEQVEDIREITERL